MDEEPGQARDATRDIHSRRIRSRRCQNEVTGGYESPSRISRRPNNFVIFP